ncbi:hypothetical protein X965_14720 [Morganella sp. EGD-HP17]|nr:hypothetical protein X965_14720 [Morganella sp. EGD-HP17]
MYSIICKVNVYTLFLLILLKVSVILIGKKKPEPLASILLHQKLSLKILFVQK